MKKYKILIVDNSLDITGALNAALYFAEYAQSAYDFMFILPTGSKAAAKVREKGFSVHFLPFVEISKRLKSLLFYLPFLVVNGIRLKRFAKKYQIDLVHINDFYNLVGVTSKLFGMYQPLITHVRFMPDRFPRFLVKIWVYLSVKHAEVVVCVSKAVKRCLPEHSKIQVIYDTLPDLDKKSAGRQTKKSEEVLNLLYLAHYIPGKGQNFALEVFYLAFQHNSKLRLKFVGGDMGLEKNIKFRQQLINRAHKLGISNVVCFAGPTSDIKQEIMVADVMLNFSESESFSFTCLEALSYGVPLIATDCGGPAELFVNSVSGILIPNRDVNAMVMEILQLSEKKKLRAKFGRNSVIYVRNKFSRKNTSQRLVEIYDRALPK